MYWYRLERSLGRYSLVGTTVQAAERLPRHLVADEKHTTLIEDKARKVYLAATAGGGCCLGLALAETAGADDLTESLRRVPGRGPTAGSGLPAGDGEHRRLARHPGGVAGAVQGGDADPLLPPRVPEDPRAGRSHEGDVRRPAGAGLEAYHAPDARSFSQRLRRLREWAEDHVDKEVVREKVLALCNKRRAFVRAYDHPGCRRTSNLVDRLLRRLDYHLYCTQHLHGTAGAAEQGLRGWALIHNFAPSCPETNPEVTGAAEPGRAAQWDAVSRRMAPEPADLGVTRRLSQPSPKSVTSRKIGASLVKQLEFRNRAISFASESRELGKLRCSLHVRQPDAISHAQVPTLALG